MTKGGFKVYTNNERLHELIDEILAIPSTGTHIEIECNNDSIPTVSWTINSYPINLDK